MKLTKTFLSVLVTVGVLSSNLTHVYAKDLAYTVQSGDSFYKIGQKYGVSTQLLMSFNNVDAAKATLYPGQTLIIPEIEGNYAKFTVKKGDTYYTISQKFDVGFSELLAFNNAKMTSSLMIGQTVKIPLQKSVQAPTPKPAPVPAPKPVPIPAPVPKPEPISVPEPKPAPAPTPVPAPTPESEPAPVQTKPYITYKNYTVVTGDNFWSLAEDFGVTYTEIITANNMTEATILKIGQVIKIPVHNIPVKSTPGAKYGELLDWWTEAQYVVPRGSVFEVVDFQTGKSFFAKRTTGANHADCEPLTLKDTLIMKEIWGGYFSWVRRPAIIKIDGRKLAASVSAAPHAGNDAVPGGEYATWRSDGYGPGRNLDWIKNNGADGVFDIHFLNSTRHMDGKLDPQHQESIKVAAGQK